MADNPCTGCGQYWRGKRGDGCHLECDRYEQWQRRDDRRQEPYKPRPPKTAYIAGPYRGASTWAIEQNIQAARQGAATLWGMGIAAFCPHANTAHMDGAAPEPVFLAGLLEILRRGGWDMLVVLPGWEQSQGTLNEIATAAGTGMAIYYWPQDTGLIRQVALAAGTGHALSGG
jgi:hypothetical protein